jgi:hypothetical protein
MGAPALRAGAPSQRRLAPFGRWPPPKKMVLVKLSWEEAGWEAFLGAEGDAGP